MLRKIAVKIFCLLTVHIEITIEDREKDTIGECRDRKRIDDKMSHAKPAQSIEKQIRPR
jgi:hypothetical protein